MIIIQPKPPAAPMQTRDSKSMKDAQSRLQGLLSGQTIPGMSHDAWRRMVDENPAQASQLIKVYRTKLGVTPPDDFPIDVKVM